MKERVSTRYILVIIAIGAIWFGGRYLIKENNRRKEAAKMEQVTVMVPQSIMDREERKKAEAEKIAAEKAEAADRTIRLSIENGDTEYPHTPISLKHRKGQTLEFAFRVSTQSMGKKLHAVLTSQDPDANIRFSQIIMPDGTADGPFGREIECDLNVSGLYALRVNENIMAGDPWEGDFTIMVKVE